MTHVISTPTNRTLSQVLSPIKRPAVLLNCTQSYSRLQPQAQLVKDFDAADACRRAWSCQPLKKARVPEVAICHVGGVVRKIYTNLVWIPASEDLRKIARILGSYCSSSQAQDALQNWTNQALAQLEGQLWCFTANEAPEYDVLLGLNLAEWISQRGQANPVRYLNCD